MNPAFPAALLARIEDAGINASAPREQLKAHFGDKVFDTVIPRNVRLAEAPSYGLPGVVFDPAARGSQAFVDFAREMIDRIRKM